MIHIHVQTFDDNLIPTSLEWVIRLNLPFSRDSRHTFQKYYIHFFENIFLNRKFKVLERNIVLKQFNYNNFDK